LAIPVVVQAPSATLAFVEGEHVHVDGSSGVVSRIAQLPHAERPVVPTVPPEQFLREAIATDPSGRPQRRAVRPGAVSSEMPAPPAAGFFHMPPARQVSEEGAPVDETDVVDERDA